LEAVHLKKEAGDKRTPPKKFWGERRHFGREGIIRTLRVGVKEGRSYLVFGGPLLGKTFLLQHLHKIFNPEGPLPEKHSYISVYHSFQERSDWTLSSLSDSLNRLIERTRPKGMGLDRLILLLDECEFFTDSSGRVLLNHLQGPLGLSHLGAPWSIVWAGNLDWYRMNVDKKVPFSEKVRWVPLATFTDQEARSMIGDFISSGKGDFTQKQVFELTGKHPFLLQGLVEYFLQSEKYSLDGLLEQFTPQWENWCQRCIEQLMKDLEKEKLMRILNFLVQRGGPVNPSMLGKKCGLKNPKPFLDKLCVLGLLERTLQNGEAVVWASCGFFNQWFLRVVTSTQK